MEEIRISLMPEYFIFSLKIVKFRIPVKVEKLEEKKTVLSPPGMIFQCRRICNSQIFILIQVDSNYLTAVGCW